MTIDITLKYSSSYNFLRFNMIHAHTSQNFSFQNTKYKTFFYILLQLIFFQQLLTYKTPYIKFKAIITIHNILPQIH